MTEEYWFSCSLFTCLVLVRAGVIVGGAPIIRRFRGQPLINLTRWQPLHQIVRLGMGEHQEVRP